MDVLRRENELLKSTINEATGAIKDLEVGLAELKVGGAHGV